jgi:hypothetical protein
LVLTNNLKYFLREYFKLMVVPKRVVKSIISSLYTIASGNLDHLAIGKYQDNMNDIKNRNRSVKGEKNYNAKLLRESHEG